VSAPRSTACLLAGVSTALAAQSIQAASHRTAYALLGVGLLALGGVVARQRKRSVTA
jgi:LPXTG-motif cell wall-anchored protein